MDTSHYAQLPVATIPALVSTGITILYFVLKLLNYLTDAKPGQTNRKETERWTDQEGQPKQGTDQRKRSSSEIPEQAQRHSRREHNGVRSLGLLWMRRTECLTMGISWILLPNPLFGDSHKAHRHQCSSREVVTFY